MTSEKKGRGVARFKKQRSDQPDDELTDAEAFAAELATAQAVVRRYRSADDIRFGAGSRCPGCGAIGFVVSVNVTLGSCENACLECHTDWRLTVRALEAVGEQQVLEAQRRLAMLPHVPEPLYAASEPEPEPEPVPEPNEVAVPVALVPPDPIFVYADSDLTIEATPEVLEAFLRAPTDDRVGPSGDSGFF